MEHRILWVVAIVMAAAALVAGCFAPSKPLVVIGDGGYREQPSKADQERVGKMDKDQLEKEVLRLTAENDRLRQDNGKLEREVKKLKQDKKDLEDRVDNLKDQIKDLKKR